MRLCRAAVRELRRSGGTIVNVSSINAFVGENDGACAHYSASKAGLDGLTRQLAVELAPTVRVVAVAPGAVDTPMAEGWLDDDDKKEAWFKRFVPLGRIARPDEIAAAIAFLASGEASYITGTTVMVDGGMAVV
jgi:NAD(P)-dependent dehydrogenase (short-subunit alcohol dehydrogenase family)